jgi:modulator of FtsH protease
MSNELRDANPYGNGAGAVEAGLLQRNRVLRNTYALLAVSLIPTVVGAFVGVQMKLGALMAGSPIISMLLFMAVAMGMMMLIERNKNSGAGVALLLGFTFIMGLMLSQILGSILGMSNGVSLIMYAFGGTAVIFGSMATIASVSKRDFSGIGKWAMVGMLVIIVAMVANIFLQLPALMLTISVIAIGIFSAMMLYDVQRVINGGETNYISATLSIYLSIYNVFVHLLSILGILGGERD